MARTTCDLAAAEFWRLLLAAINIQPLSPMPWFVRYKKSAEDQLARMRTPEQAIETACRLLDDGCEVYGIGTGALTDSIEKEQIARIYDLWVRARSRSQRA
jgi:hypothetical protein